MCQPKGTIDSGIGRIELEVTEINTGMRRAEMKESGFSPERSPDT